MEKEKGWLGPGMGERFFFLSNILHIFKFWTMWILPTFKSKEIKIIIKKLRQENSYKMMEYGNAEKKGNSPRKPLLHVPSALLSLTMDYQICVSSELAHCNVNFASHDSKYIGSWSSQHGSSAMQSH